MLAVGHFCMAGTMTRQEPALLAMQANRQEGNYSDTSRQSCEIKRAQAVAVAVCAMNVWQCRR